MVTMTVVGGKTRTFGNLRDAVAWMEGQLVPRCDERVTISLPREAKELLRSAGKMSTIGRALILRATGARWVSRERRAKKLRSFLARAS